MLDTLRNLMGGYWQWTVIFLTLNNLITDILSRKHLAWLALLSGLINTIGWILLLGTKAPFARSITLYAISSYALTVIVASVFFAEAFTRWQLLGIAFGGIAVALLV